MMHPLGTALLTALLAASVSALNPAAPARPGVPASLTAQSTVLGLGAPLPAAPR